MYNKGKAVVTCPAQVKNKLLYNSGEGVVSYNDTFCAFSIQTNDSITVEDYKHSDCADSMIVETRIS